MHVIVAAETTDIKVRTMADVVDISSPGDFHLRKDILGVGFDDTLNRCIKQSGAFDQKFRVVFTVPVFKTLCNSLAGLLRSFDTRL